MVFRSAVWSAANLTKTFSYAGEAAPFVCRYGAGVRLPPLIPIKGVVVLLTLSLPCSDSHSTMPPIYH